MSSFYLFRYSIVLIIICCFSCNNGHGNDGQKKVHKTTINKEGLDSAVFASGCFWCVEAIFQRVIGVEEAVSGYAGGNEQNPTYEQVSRGRTGHAEAVMVYYDPGKISYSQLVEVFFGSHDPTTLNQQGPDVGKQYRSAIFYINEGQRKQAQEYIEGLRQKKVHKGEITTEVSKLQKFWPAEDYHQEYEEKNPNDPYVKRVSIPRIKEFEKKYPQYLKEEYKNPSGKH